MANSMPSTTGASPVKEAEGTQARAAEANIPGPARSTLAGQLVTTAKLFTVVGLVGLVLWLLDHWVSR